MIVESSPAVETLDDHLARLLGGTVIEQGRIRIRSTPLTHIEVLVMIDTLRVVETPISNDRVYDRFWCFADVSHTIAALTIWHYPDEEPKFWVKAWCGCRDGKHRIRCAREAYASPKMARS